MQVAITSDVMAWLESVVEHGAFTVDASGRGYLSPGVKQVVDALHEVLAGGVVDIRVVTPGDPAIRDALGDKLQAAMVLANRSGPQLFAP